MKVFHGRTDGAKSELRGETFSGEVWADPVMPATDGVTINTVLFAPRGRTYWHTHEYGQVLTVTAGKGWICKDGEAPQPIRQGDIVFIGPNGIGMARATAAIWCISRHRSARRRGRKKSQRRTIRPACDADRGTNRMAHTRPSPLSTGTTR
jgi:quercetin dioxygenase-like cupin family protein